MTVRSDAERPIAEEPAVLEVYLETIRLAAFDTLDSIRSGCPDLAYLNARDAAHYAHLMLADVPWGDADESSP